MGLKERRKHPRFIMSVPLHFQINKDRGAYPGLSLDLSQSGFMIQTLKEMSVGTKLIIEILLPKNLKLPKLRAEAEIIWRDIGYWEDWEGYQYGLKFTRISDEDCLILSRVLSNPACLKEAQFIEDPVHDPTLVEKK